MQPLADGSSLWAIVAVALLWLAAFGLGRRLLFVGRTAPGTSVVDQCLAAIVGMNVIACFGATAGQLRLFQIIAPSYCLLCLALLCALAEFVRLRAITPRQLRTEIKRVIGRAIIGYWPLLLLAVLTLGPALVYPDGWDELVYHHTLVRLWMSLGYPAVVADLPYSAFPSLAEILCWLASSIDPVFTPRLVTWSSWLMTLFLLVQLLKRFTTHRQAMCLTVSLAISNAMLMIVNNAYVESTLAMNFVAMLTLMVSESGWGLEPRQMRWSAVVGILAASIVSIKLTGISVLSVVAWHALILSRAGKQRSVEIPRVVLSMVFMALLIFAFALPFYARAWIATGNPFSPYFAQWFSSDPAALAISRFHHALGDNFGTRHWAALVTGPILISWEPLLFDGNFGLQTLLMLCLTATAVVRAWGKQYEQSRAVRWLFASAVSLYLFWFATAQQARFAIPVWICLTILAGAGQRQLSPAMGRWVAPLILVLALVSAPWHFAGYYFSSWASATGAFPMRDHVDEGTGFGYLTAMDAIDRLAPDARVLLLFEHRGFYCPRSYVIGTPEFQSALLTPIDHYTEPAAVMAALADHQITHILLARKQNGPDLVHGFDERVSPLLIALERCLNDDRLLVQWSSDDYHLIDVRR